jgi:hypothetical protein
VALRSVHNIRIERLWQDVTKDVGTKWMEFFTDLEVHHGLDVSNRDHIWLLHHLFLEGLNDELFGWIGMWNSHTLSIKGSPNRSPNQLYLHGMLTQGTRGLATSQPEGDEDAEDEGIDWPAIQAARGDRPPEADVDRGPGDSFPRNPPEVTVETPTCPHGYDFLRGLESLVNETGLRGSKHLMDKLLLWERALAYFQECTLNTN